MDLEQKGFNIFEFSTNVNWFTRAAEIFVIFVAVMWKADIRIAIILLLDRYTDCKFIIPDGYKISKRNCVFQYSCVIL